MIAKAEIEALTGIRFFAALFVMLHHISVDYVEKLFPAAASITSTLFYSGGMGVDLFFILSGFILSYNYLDMFTRFSVRHYAGFLYKRIARIYPVYLATLLILVILAVIRFSGGIYPGLLNLHELPENILLLQAWKVPASFAWNTVSWSVSAEWLAYLLFPLFARHALKLQSARMITGLIALLYIGLLLSILPYVLIHANGVLQFPSLRDIGLLRILFEFPMGVLVYVLFLRQGAVHKDMPGKVWIAMVLLGFFTPLAAFWAIPCFAWIIYLIAVARFPFRDFLASPWIVYGGRISYCLYLVHGAGLVIFSIFFPVSLFVDAGLYIRLLYIAAYILSTMMLTLLLYHFVEEPCRRWLLSKWPAA